MHKRHRIFIAINLPGDVKKFLAGFQKKWPDLPAKWTPEENLHITLLFLGDLTDVELGQVCLDAKEVASRHRAFNITLQKIAYGPEGKVPPRAPKFLNSNSVSSDMVTEDENIDNDALSMPKLRSPRYIWAGGQANSEASKLKKDLEDALFESIKFKIDKNSFTAHVTLARIKDWEWRAIEPEERPEVSQSLDATFTVESIEVMESELTRQGPRYVIIESHQLK